MEISHFMSFLNMVNDKSLLHQRIQLHVQQHALCCKVGSPVLKAAVIPGLKRSEQSLGTCFHCIGNY